MPVSDTEDAKAVLSKDKKQTSPEQRIEARRVLRKNGVTSDDVPGDGLAQSAGKALEKKQDRRRSLLDSL